MGFRLCSDCTQIKWIYQLEANLQTHCTLERGGSDMVLLSWHRPACIKEGKHHWADRKAQNGWSKVKSVRRTHRKRSRWISEIKSWSRKNEGQKSSFTPVGFIQVNRVLLLHLCMSVLISLHMCMCAHRHSCAFLHGCKSLRVHTCTHTHIFSVVKAKHLEPSSLSCSHLTAHHFSYRFYCSLSFSLDSLGPH